MPKIFGTSLLGILAASVALYFVGFLIYGILFQDQWLAFNNMTMEEATAINQNLGAMMYVFGFLITILQVVGLSYVLQQSGASLLGTCAKIGAIIAALFALPLMAYAVLYEGRSTNALWLDFGHILIGYALAGAVLSFFRGKDAIDPA